jgi:nitrite reductase/ring-hydroxylating ferredoxin subunit
VIVGLLDAPTLDPERLSTMENSWTSRALGPLEEAAWLETASETLMRWLQPLVSAPGADRFKDFLHGRWLGHALHPVLTDAPIGFWLGAAALDAVGEDFGAGVLSAAGSASAVATAVTGLADWTVTDGRERRLALLHGLVNVGGLCLQVASLTARVRGRRRAAKTLSFCGLGVSLGAAYLGGELVFARGLMVNHDAWIAGPNKWTPVLPSAQVADGSTKRVDVRGHSVLVYRERGAVYAMEDACAHAGGPLSEGEVKDGVVTCPWHGSQFRLTDGAVLRGPATFPQLRLQARERQGQIEIRGRRG